MNAALTYHSVGTSENKFLSKLPSVDIKMFRNQLKALSKKYNIVGTEEFLTTNSENKILLTFDDGLKCHYETVAPILDEMNLPAIFFVSSGPTIYREMLLVHQLQILVSESKNNKAIFKNLLDFSIHHCGSIEDLIQKDKNLHIHRYESSEYNFIKKSFQIFIDKNIAMNHLKETFEQYFPSEKSLFEDMYVNIDECKEMISHGFDIGGHSRSHRWMQYLDKNEIHSEINSDIIFFDKLNFSNRYYCYPYGSYSDLCIDAIKDAGFEYAFTIESGNFEPLNHDPFRINRFDVNEFFKDILK